MKRTYLRFRRKANKLRETKKFFKHEIHEKNETDERNFLYSKIFREFRLFCVFRVKKIEGITIDYWFVINQSVKIRLIRQIRERTDLYITNEERLRTPHSSLLTPN